MNILKVFDAHACGVFYWVILAKLKQHFPKFNSLYGFQLGNKRNLHMI